MFTKIENLLEKMAEASESLKVTAIFQIMFITGFVALISVVVTLITFAMSKSIVTLTIMLMGCFCVSYGTYCLTINEIERKIK